MKSIKLENYNIYASDLDDIGFNSDKQTIINTINAHSYIIAKSDLKFKKALVTATSYYQMVKALF